MLPIELVFQTACLASETRQLVNMIILPGGIMQVNPIGGMELLVFPLRKGKLAK